MSPSTLLRETVSKGSRWRLSFLIAVGIIAGAAAGLNASARWESITTAQVWSRILLGAAMATGAVLILDAATRKVVMMLDLEAQTKERYLKYDAFSALVFLVPLLGASGFQLHAPVILATGLVLPFLKGILLYAALQRAERDRVFASLGWLAFLFLLSGMAALIYQIVWQRVLFATFGINIESITIIVSLFMLGLGLGSIAGGLVARRYPDRLVLLFVICEGCIGLFGLFSLKLIETVSAATIHGSLVEVSAAVFALLGIPTMLMGATLPILVSHLSKWYKNLGKTVGLLYFINTLGSAIACFLTADLLFVLLGERAAVLVAVACNWTVAALVVQYARRLRARDGLSHGSAGDVAPPPARDGLPSIAVRESE